MCQFQHFDQHLLKTYAAHYPVTTQPPHPIQDIPRKMVQIGTTNIYWNSVGNIYFILISELVNYQLFLILITYVDWILISGFWSLDTDAFLLISIIGQWKIHSEYWLISFSYSPQTILTAPQKIATGETSQAITSLDYFNLYHKIIFINTIE